LSSTNNIKITDSFLNLLPYKTSFEMVGNLESGVILIFMFDVINQVSHVSKEFKLIADTIVQVKYILNI
jgi:hypothetical protein